MCVMIVAVVRSGSGVLHAHIVAPPDSPLCRSLNDEPVLQVEADCSGPGSLDRLIDLARGLAVEKELGPVLNLTC